jgi:hypothetical protein
MLENEIPLIGEEFRFYSSIFCLIVLIYFSYKKPAGILFIGYIINSGLGSSTIFSGISFAIVSFLIQGITILNLIGSKKELLLDRRSILYCFLLLILVSKILLSVWFTVSFEILYIYFEILKTFLFSVVFPFFIFLLSVKKFGTKDVSKHILEGTFFLSLAVIVPFLVPLFSTGYFFDAINGSVRLQMYSIDTINGCRIFFLLALSSLLLLITKIEFIFKRNFLILIFIFSYLLVILTGTRQFILSIFFISLLSVFILNLKVNKFFVVFASVLIMIFSVFVNLSENESIKRLQFDALKEEKTMELGRGDIWSLGFYQMLTESPFLGLGYSNFGGGFYMETTDSGVKSYNRNMKPHGFFQSVFIEQGMILGLLLFIFYLVLIKGISVFLNGNVSLFVIFSFILSFNFAESFSSDVENAFSFYLIPLIFLKRKHD